MPFELFIARRYLRSTRRPKLLSIHTVISLAGVMAGVAALIMVLAVFNGLNYEIKTRLIGLEGHLQFQLQATSKGLANYQQLVPEIKQVPQVTGVAPYLIELALLASGNFRHAVQVKGIDMQLEPEVSELPNLIIAGAFKLDSMPQATSTEPALPGILVGYGLAQSLGLNLSQQITLISSAGLSAGSAAFFNPKVKRFRISGIFRTGLLEIDQNMVMIDLQVAQPLFNYGSEVAGLTIKVKDLNNATEIAQDLNRRYPAPFLTKTWYQKNKMLFNWMRLEKWAAFIVLTLIVMVAGFNIISTLTMVVMEKMGAIGILKSMGASHGLISRIFLIQGTVIGVIGTLCGVVLGYGGCWLQQTCKLVSIPNGVFFMDALPVRIEYWDLLTIAVVAVGLSLLASFYPAQKAARLDPVTAIHSQS
ncbi:ABC transporter permease [candidate division KSB1 bacterium]|nr:ABC transporter permease [candidate division KSB1 bacterium]